MKFYYLQDLGLQETFLFKTQIYRIENHLNRELWKIKIVGSHLSWGYQIVWHK